MSQLGVRTRVKLVQGCWFFLCCSYATTVALQILANVEALFLELGALLVWRGGTVHMAEDNSAILKAPVSSAIP
jgi:hypothetical protein